MGKISYTVSGRPLTMSAETTEAYEDPGPLGDETRREMRRDARTIAARLGRSVEVYAADEAGGWVAEHVTADAQAMSKYTFVLSFASLLFGAAAAACGSSDPNAPTRPTGCDGVSATHYPPLADAGCGSVVYFCREDAGREGAPAPGCTESLPRAPVGTSVWCCP